jgi:GH15 family glucan-1,4-alpha-glucosidase
MRAPDDQRVDAALLLAQVRSACAPEDPRSVATREAVLAELVDDDYVYRIAPRSGSLGDEEGAFLICNFWLSMAALGAGDVGLAERMFERGRSASGSPGLYAEQFDVAAHQLRGNLPQAFVHASLIEAAAALSDGFDASTRA